jgi:RNA polymerase sigma-70 factor (ECF subfamily)
MDRFELLGNLTHDPEMQSTDQGTPESEQFSSENSTARVSFVHKIDADVIRKFEPAVRRYCRSRCSSPEDADDAVQDTFLRYLRRSEARIRNHEAWLIRAASRACADIARRQARDDKHRLTGHWKSSLERDEELVFSHPTADPERITVEQLTVSALLRQLTPRERTVVTHLYLLGASVDQVATYLGVSPAHLRVIALRARRHARALLTAMDQPASD